jgi:cobalt/nickel transport system permease protein
MLYAPKPMHIPDGFLSVTVAVVMWLIAIAVIAYALKRASKDLGERQVPLMGVLAACIFAGQMLNFAVAGGTSGHLLGAALAAILLGPWAAVLVLTTVVGVQALIFQDGGLLALGANIFNMAVVGVFVANFGYRSMQRLIGRSRWGVPVSGFVAGWLSVFVAALATALELALSGTSPANIAVVAMGSIHALIGIGEGLITAGALAVIAAARPDLLRQGQAQAAIGGRAVWVGGLIIALGLAVASPLASAHPDGLEWVAEQKGFLDAAQAPVFEIVPDYVLPGVANQALATILAGMIGVLIVAGVALAVAYTRRTRRPETS